MADGRNHYETVIVTSAKLGEEGSAELVNRFKALIEEHGTVEGVDDWGKRRFAYPIQKQTEGYYTLIYFESAPDFTAELDRRYQITDGVLRTLIVKRDPRYLDVQTPLKPQSEENENVEAEPVAEAAETAPVESAPVEAAPEETPAPTAPEGEATAEETAPPAGEAPTEEVPETAETEE